MHLLFDFCMFESGRGFLQTVGQNGPVLLMSVVEDILEACDSYIIFSMALTIAI